MSKKVYMIPNPHTSRGVEIDPEICTGCNICVENCRTQVLLPNPKKGEPAIIMYPDECWLCGWCQMYCPTPGAIRQVQPIRLRVGWKRKETGEHFRLGMSNPPPPNLKPPVGDRPARSKRVTEN